jgi:DNA-binding NarL/FixJ family response regulator
MIRLILADDHAIVRGGLRKLLAESSDLTVVAEAADGRQALQLALHPTLAWDVLVLDLSLPRVGGIEVLRRVREARPDARVVVLSMYPEDQYALQMRREGAAAYVSKTMAPETLLEAVRAVAATGAWSSPATARRLDANDPSADPLPHRTLSSRELQVFNLILEGHAVADIAAQLDLRSSTVSNHLKAIKTKLDAPTVADIVRYAVRVGIID